MIQTFRLRPLTDQLQREWYQNSALLTAEREVSDVLRDVRDPAADLASNIRSPLEEQQRKKAEEELRYDEARALLACFAGPLFGGWLLHIIRSSLSRPSEGLVSNFNLTIFVLAAELRPAAQVVKLLRGRNEYLQSLVHHPPVSKMETLASKVEELHAEVRELSALTARAIEREADLDALNREFTYPILLVWTQTDTEKERFAGTRGKSSSILNRPRLVSTKLMPSSTILLALLLLLLETNRPSQYSYSSGRVQLSSSHLHLPGKFSASPLKRLKRLRLSSHRYS